MKSSIDRETLALKSRRCSASRLANFARIRNYLMCAMNVSLPRKWEPFEVRDIAQSHLNQVREKQAELRALAIHLQRFVAACDAACIGGPGCDCVIFQEIANPKTSSNCC